MTQGGRERERAFVHMCYLRLVTAGLGNSGVGRHTRPVMVGLGVNGFIENLKNGLCQFIFKCSVSLHTQNYNLLGNSHVNDKHI